MRSTRAWSNSISTHHGSRSWTAAAFGTFVVRLRLRLNRRRIDTRRRAFSFLLVLARDDFPHARPPRRAPCVVTAKRVPAEARGETHSRRGRVAGELEGRARGEDRRFLFFLLRSVVSDRRRLRDFLARRAEKQTERQTRGRRFVVKRVSVKTTSASFVTALGARTTRATLRNTLTIFGTFTSASTARSTFCSARNTRAFLS